MLGLGDAGRREETTGQHSRLRIGEGGGEGRGMGGEGRGEEREECGGDYPVGVSQHAVVRRRRGRHGGACCVLRFVRGGA